MKEIRMKQWEIDGNKVQREMYDIRGGAFGGSRRKSFCDAEGVEISEAFNEV